MSFEQAIQDLATYLTANVPGFVLVVFRLGAMMAFAPLFGSGKVPRRVKGLMTLVLALGVGAAIPMPQHLPETIWGIAVGIGGEILFGVAMGMVMSFTFIAAQWAGEMIGQQMGLNMSEIFDPQFGQAGSLIGDLYFMLTLVVFLTVRGHHAMLRGVRASFEALPLMSVGMDRPLFELIVGLFSAAAILAIQLAAPMLVTMLIVDLALGCISKTMPQLNVMTAGISIRSVVGLLVLVVGLSLTTWGLRGALERSMTDVELRYATPAAH